MINQVLQVSGNPIVLAMLRGWTTSPGNGRPYSKIIAVIPAGLRFLIQRVYVSTITGILMVKCRESWLEDGVTCYDYHIYPAAYIESIELIS